MELVGRAVIAAYLMMQCFLEVESRDIVKGSGGPIFSVHQVLAGTSLHHTLARIWIVAATTTNEEGYG
jgi:hypothetical protein